MKLKYFAAIGLATLLSEASSQAATIAAWTFETSGSTFANLSNSTALTGVAAEVGTGTASGLHASADTDYSSPSGNGSAESMSSNTWSVGDYYQFTTSSTGFSEGIVFSFDHTGSNTGPANFQLQYSTNGTTFTDFAGGAYSVVNTTWAVGTPVATNSYSFDLSSVSGLSNATAIAFRLVNTSTTAISSPNAVAAGGTSRVDNVTISTVPEPSSLMIAGLGALVVLRRRR